ncbi:MAG: biotin/lipoyl-binding protein [Deltaproteobacteria bacterium]|nr:biotin/lipoyl-binding protein [Deltaproteobacteria bacterium]
MRNRLLIGLAIVGISAGLFTAFVHGKEKRPPPPVFNPAPNPYARGVYANGIVESVQPSGENINLFPEVAGRVVQILVHEGDHVRQGTPLLRIDDSIQRANTEQLKAQSEAAHAVLQELQAQPRPEVLAVSQAQLVAAQASRKTAQDELDKQMTSYKLNPKSVSKETLDNAVNTLKSASANVDVAQKQLQLTEAGAWSYDIENQRKQYEALQKSYEAASALLAKYVLYAPTDGVVMSIRAPVGGYVASNGIYDTYTQGLAPVITFGTEQTDLQVRCYVDEILIHNLPPGAALQGKLFIRGTDISIPLEYAHIQPYVIPKIQLSNALTERVDVRVLPVLFHFVKPTDVSMYPGQLVDVYIEAPGGPRQPVMGRAPPP